MAEAARLEPLAEEPAQLYSARPPFTIDPRTTFAPRAAAALGGSAVAHQEQVTERYWTWCSKWYVPYPCRKTRTVTKWCYDFSYLTVDYHYVYTNYVGCELNALYSWRKWELNGSGDSFTLYFVTRCFDNLKTSSGPCSPQDAVIFLKKALGDDYDDVVTGKRQFGESSSSGAGSGAG